MLSLVRAGAGDAGKPLSPPLYGLFCVCFLFLFRCRIGAALTHMARICAGKKSCFTPAFTVKKMCDMVYIFLAHILHGIRALMSAA